MKNKKCDCWIGMLHSFNPTYEDGIYLSDYIEKTKERAKDCWWVISPKDYIDGRRKLSMLFNYCPNCGEKINWAKLRKALSEGT